MRPHALLSVAFACAWLGSILAAGEEPSEAENLAPNPGFEKPADGVGSLPDLWVSFATKTNGMAITRDNKRHGEQCLMISAQEVAGAIQGLILDLPVTPGQKYTFSAYVLNNRSDPLGGSATGQLVIEWKGPTGKDIARAVSSSWNANLSRMRWESVSVNKAEVPDGAVRGVFSIQLSDGGGGGKGSVFVDDVLIER